MVVNLGIYVMLGLTFMFADESGIHTGVITSLFCTSLIFTSVYFLIFHGQKLQKSDYIGILLVVICVILISLSEGEEHEPTVVPGTHTVTLDDGSTTEESDFDINKLLAIVFALGTGVIFSTNSIEMHYS
jgi:drug/metabolite transporter (DMT)-like permease